MQRATMTMILILTLIDDYSFHERMTSDVASVCKLHGITWQYCLMSWRSKTCDGFSLFFAQAKTGFRRV